jgi:hypothetical protein
MLRDRTSEILLAFGLGLEVGAVPFPLGVKEDMEAQKGSVGSYCDWMALDGSPEGVLQRFLNLFCALIFSVN